MLNLESGKCIFPMYQRKVGQTFLSAQFGDTNNKYVIYPVIGYIFYDYTSEIDEMMLNIVNEIDTVSLSHHLEQKNARTIISNKTLDRHEQGNDYHQFKWIFVPISALYYIKQIKSFTDMNICVSSIYINNSLSKIHDTIIDDSILWNLFGFQKFKFPSLLFHNTANNEKIMFIQHGHRFHIIGKIHDGENKLNRLNTNKLMPDKFVGDKSVLDKIDNKKYCDSCDILLYGTVYIISHPTEDIIVLCRWCKSICPETINKRIKYRNTKKSIDSSYRRSDMHYMIPLITAFVQHIEENYYKLTFKNDQWVVINDQQLPNGIIVETPPLYLIGPKFNTKQYKHSQTGVPLHTIRINIAHTLS